MQDVKQEVKRYWEALKEVMDPEFPVSVVDMGLIYEIEETDAVVSVTMTYTAVSCACMEWIEADIKKKTAAGTGCAGSANPCRVESAVDRGPFKPGSARENEKMGG